MDYLTIVMNPAGMNLPELRNLSPITAVRVPEVPAWQRELKKHQSVSCVVVKTLRLTYLKKAKYFLDFEIPYKHRGQLTSQTGALQPER